MSDSQDEKLWDLHRRVLVSLIQGDTYPDIRCERLEEMEDLNYEEIMVKSGNMSFSTDHELVGAYPVSPRSTDYVIDIEGIGKGYAMCAVDAIGAAFTFQAATTIHARDKTTGSPIIMTVTPEMTTSPGYTWWMTYKTSCEPGELTALAQCPTINFHSIKPTGDLGPNMIVMNDIQSYEHARSRFHYTTLKSRIAEVLNSGKTLTVI